MISLCCDYYLLIFSQFKCFLVCNFLLIQFHSLKRKPYSPSWWSMYFLKPTSYCHKNFRYLTISGLHSTAKLLYFASIFYDTYIFCLGNINYLFVSIKDILECQRLKQEIKYLWIYDQYPQAMFQSGTELLIFFSIYWLFFQ